MTLRKLFVKLCLIMNDSQNQPGSNFLTAKNASEKYPQLKGYLDLLPDETVLNIAELYQRYAPGKPMDKLGALVVILSFLRAG